MIKINLPNVCSLGQLREDFKNGPPPDVSLASQFVRISFPRDGESPDQHYILHGEDGGILGYYIPASYLSSCLQPDFPPTLTHLIKALPLIGKPRTDKNVSQSRMIPNSRTYAGWRGRQADDVSEESAIYKQDNEKGGKGCEFAQHWLSLWEVIGSIFKEICPRAYNHHDLLPPSGRSSGRSLHDDDNQLRFNRLSGRFMSPSRRVKCILSCVLPVSFRRLSGRRVNSVGIEEDCCTEAWRCLPFPGTFNHSFKYPCLGRMSFIGGVHQRRYFEILHPA